MNILSINEILNSTLTKREIAGEDEFLIYLMSTGTYSDIEVHRHVNA